MSGRIRTIKPEILEDVVTAGLSDAAFRAFVAIITLSDDHGYFRAEPSLLAAQIWWKATPTAPIESVMSELSSLIEWYVVKDQRYGYIRNWSKHQKVQKPGKQRIPPPCEVDKNPPESLQRTAIESPIDLRTDQGSGTIGSKDLGPSPDGVGGERLREVCPGNAVNRNGLPPPDPEPDGEEPPAVVKLKAEERYAIAYAEGQARASKAEFPVPGEPWERGAIATIIQTYLPELKGEELLEGIRATSAAYRRARDDHGRFESGFRPKKCLDWCASSGWKYKPPSAPRRAAPKPVETTERVDPQFALDSITAAIGGGARRL